MYTNNQAMGFSPSKQESEMSKIHYNGNEYDMDAARNLMDDEICNQIHGTVDTEQEFVDAYAEAHLEKFGEEWVMS